MNPEGLHRRARRPFGRAWPLLLPLLAAGLAPSAVAGQDPVQQEILRRTGQNLSQEEIIARLRDSGMTREQVKQRLREMGMNPAMADPYFDRLEGRAEGRVEGDQSDFASALRRMGLLSPLAARDTLTGDSLMVGDSLAADSTRLRRDRLGLFGDEKPDSLKVFGMEVFARNTSEFEPMRTGPVPPDYRLGPGDELMLLLTGDVELAYNLQVSREGSVVIPDVGNVFVNGLTLAQLESRLYDRLGRVYSGVRRGADATTHFQVSMGRLRVNQVFVVGEVRFPGAYEVSSVATALTALYRAGGPRETGSFRRVQIRRGGRTVAEVDLYDYLLAGDVSRDVRLEQGDIVFVPIVDAQVRVGGRVKRPRFYQTLPDEGVIDALGFAGGPAPEADLRRVQVDRILPPLERVPGRDRVVSRVDVVEAVRSDADVPLSDGDVVRVFPIGEERRDMIVLDGFVQRPGEYELRPQMTVWDAIQQAGGLRPEAFAPLAHVSRLNPADSTYRLLRVSLERTATGQPVSDLPLADQDSVMVFGNSSLVTPRNVRILGAVKEPEEYTFKEGMTVEDLILAAGGFEEGAHGLQAEISRVRPGISRSDTVATSFHVTLDGSIPWSLQNRVGRPVDNGRDSPRAADVELMEGDQVFIRRLPGFVEPTSVEISGEVMAPGSYAFTVREERLSSFIRRTGGLTDDAYAQGTRLIRDSTLVAMNLERALTRPGSTDDPILRDGDILEVPRYDGTVLIRGAVAFESRVIYREDMDLSDYLSRAGGTLPEADKSRISVQYENGERVTTKKTLWIERYPEVGPGSTIFVPFEPEGEGTNWGQIISTTVGVMSATATLILALARF